MPSLAARLKKLILGARPPDREDAATHVAAEYAGAPGHGVVLGMAGTGKSVFVSQLASRLQGCRVVLGLTGDEPPGWEEAPFWGTLRTPAGLLEDWDLEDVLRQRPEGQFDLLVPFAHARRVQRALSYLLATYGGKGAGIRPLWLTVDEPSGLVDVPTLTDVMRLARKDNLRVTVAVQSLRDLGTVGTADVQHLCVLQASAADLPQLAAMTGLSCETLIEPRRGQCTYIRGGVSRDLRVPYPTA